MTWRLYAFDFDGTLVDSYSCLPAVWRRIGEYLNLEESFLDLFVKYVLIEEDLGDVRGEHDVSKWVRRALDKLKLEIDFNSEELAALYWKYRIEGTTVLPCVEDILKVLKEKECIVASVSGDDGVKSLKKKRIMQSGLSRFFDNIIVAGEDVPGKGDAMVLLADKYGLSRRECVLIDDKPGPINDVSKKGFPTIKVDFKCILKEAWKDECSPTVRLRNICELLNFI